MAKNTAALAARYQELGFRVIEGEGKSDLVLKSPGLAWAVARRHDHVIGDIREHRQKIEAPELGARFDEHVRASEYRSLRTGKTHPCFELTQTGVLIVGAKYDATLQLLTALLFDAVSTSNELEADSIVRQLTARLKEIRAKARQGELDLTIVPGADIAVELDHDQHVQDYERRQHDLDEDPAAAALVPIPKLKDIAHQYEPFAHNAGKIEVWIEQEEGTSYVITKERDAKGDVCKFKCLRDPPIKTSTDGFSLLMPWINGSQVYLQLNHIIPLAVLERIYLAQLPDSNERDIAVKNVARNTLKWFLAL